MDMHSITPNKNNKIIFEKKIEIKSPNSIYHDIKDVKSSKQEKNESLFHFFFLPILTKQKKGRITKDASNNDVPIAQICLNY